MVQVTPEHNEFGDEQRGGTLLPAPPAKLDLGRIFGETTKYTVFAAFLLYVIGFLTWHAYLGRYGTSAVPFLQAEYLSAALCYLLISISLAIGPLLFSRHLCLKIFKKRQKPENLVTFLLWSTLCVFVPPIFFNAVPSEAIRRTVLVVLILVLAFHFLIVLIFWLVWRSAKVHGFLLSTEWFAFYVMGAALAIYATTPGMNPQFFNWTVTFAVLGPFIYAIIPHELNASRPEFSRTLLGLLGATFVMLHVLIFGEVQFLYIPKSVGGGRPETAYLKFSRDRPELAASLNLPIISNAPLAGYSGPVSLLLRSEHELIFLNDADLRLPETYTNEALLSIKTNLGMSFSTNWSTTVAKRTGVTNRTAAVLATSFQTNVYNISRVVFKNPVRLTAKQVRVDLIDAVVFAK